MPTTRSTPMETALLNKLDRLPITPRRKIRLHRFDFSKSPVLCWYHSVTRLGRHYTLQCDVLGDGSLEVSLRSVSGSRKPLRMPKAKRFPGQLGY